LVLGFTPTASRYIYPLLPAFYLLGAYALLSGLNALLALARQGIALSNRQFALFIQLLLCASVLILPIFPSGSYNLLVSRMTGLPYHRHFPDYDASGQYVKQHWRSGDIVVSISP